MLSSSLNLPTLPHYPFVPPQGPRGPKGDIGPPGIQGPSGFKVRTGPQSDDRAAKQNVDFNKYHVTYMNKVNVENFKVETRRPHRIRRNIWHINIWFLFLCTNRERRESRGWPSLLTDPSYQRQEAPRGPKASRYRTSDPLPPSNSGVPYSVADAYYSGQ